MRSFTHLGLLKKVILLALVFSVSSLCLISCNETLEKPANITLAEFIIGRWVNKDNDVEYTFEKNNVFKVYAGDGTTCTYQFVSSDEILVDCRPRVIETWIIRVERDNQLLLVHYSDGNTSIFERMNPRTIIID